MEEDAGSLTTSEVWESSERCGLCKATKKGCDRGLPKCGRCDRLDHECIYPPSEKPARKKRKPLPRTEGIDKLMVHQGEQWANTDAHTHTSDPHSSLSNSRFEEVFLRLQRLEQQVFASNHSTITPPKSHTEEQAPISLDTPPRSQIEGQTPREITNDNWALKPGLLKTTHVQLVLFGTLSPALKAKNTTCQAVAHQYFRTVGRWLPMISRTKIDNEISAFRQLDSSSRFQLLILAMLLLSDRLDEEYMVTPSDHPYYRACKYFFAHFTALGTPCIEWIQVGMLIALFEHFQCVDNRAPATLGVCIRLAYDLDLDDAVAGQSSCTPGEMTPQSEEMVLTWWGLQRLERYFNMPPTGRLKPLFMPLQHSSDNVNGRSYAGPPVSGFATVDRDTLFASITELEASQRLGQVQMFMRNNCSSPLESIAESGASLLRSIMGYLVMLKVQMRNEVSWAGVAVVLEAALELQLFLLGKNEDVGVDVLRSIHSTLEQMNEVVQHCRVVNGFTEDYMEGLQPTWFSIAYHALRGYHKIRTLDTQSVLPAIELKVGMEYLPTMSKRYRLPGKYLELLAECTEV
ncbi:unnamed protein product [Periconia digitata]|uniref:Zn(2)-C6 fungal-type domain-containing protein n=1 Tax=Periconia digitata TaxID=1303443 RepID=A0A9W4U9S3_9PLEO|nr:unnamed protein product [Periconia digitata]